MMEAGHHHAIDVRAVEEGLAKMRGAGLSASACLGFERRLEAVLVGEAGTLRDADIRPVPALPHVADHPAADAPLDELVVIKLNGGLGTSMGLHGPKALIEVRQGRTFLDVIAGQLLAARHRHRARLPLVLMTSPATERATDRWLAAHPELRSDLPASFLQSVEPKLDARTLRPVTWPADPALEWCPPGHGEVWDALRSSGVLHEALRHGYRFAFVSNSDNLAATPSPAVLAAVAATGAPLTMEVVEGTASDRKGGHLALHDGRLVLRETAQVSAEDAASFSDVRRWRFYNTNSLWVDLEGLERALDACGGALSLPVIVNEKTVDPRDPASPRVVQLETAMGSAIGAIAGASAVVVPRSRFAPVKTTDDLLVLWSDVYALGDDAFEAVAPAPFVQLDRQRYRTLDQLRRRFPHGAPSLRECQSLVVEGDVTFGAGVRIRGAVELRTDQPLQIPDGEVLAG